MIVNYLQSTLRNFRKNKFHSSITILGLSVGLMASLLAYLFVLDEKSFDQFHEKKDRLYRLNKISTDADGTQTHNAESSGLFGPGMKDEFPEVESFVRYQPWYNPVVLSNKDRHLELGEAEAVFVDSTFFTVFDFELIRGDRKKVLTKPSTIVITESVAQTLFGDEDPIGRTVIGLNGLDYEITGIAATPPRNSHIQFKSLISWSTTVPQLGPLGYGWLNNWNTQTLTTYLLLYPEADDRSLQAKFPKFLQDHLPTRVGSYDFYLQHFNDLYLNSHNLTAHRMATAGNKEYVYLFSIIAGFILFIACVNYININTSKATRRAREVGMRKSLGASRKQLVQQFLGESFLITFISTLVGILLLYLIIPYFNTISGKSVPIETLLQPDVWIASVILLLAVAVLSGIYPAFVLSSFKPIEVLRVSAKNKATGNWARYVLITVQFAISIAMVAGALLVFQQMRFIFSKDLGFDKDHVLVLELTENLMNNGEVLENEVRNHPDVASVSRCRIALGGGSYTDNVIPEGFPNEGVEVRMFGVDMNFQETYQLDVAMGRFFDKMIASDSNAVLINETLLNQLQWDDPLQKTIRLNEEDISRPVIGVLQDFYFKSLYEQMEPLLMFVQPRNKVNMSIRFSGDPSSLISFLEEQWKTYEPRYPFRYNFVDEKFAQAYQADSKLFETVIVFAGLSIFIACLGLYGLVSFTIEQRIKEFGIRKVLGATIADLNILVNRKFIWMVCISGLICVPLILPLMNSWLNKFAFHIEVSPWIFVLAIAITLVITFSAVSIQTIRAALVNPVQSLRHE